MSKPIKDMVTRELRDRYAGVVDACVVELSGLNVQQQEKIRGALREKGARLEVVKNGLARRAFRETPLEPLGESLQGPCALVVSSQSLIGAAKVLVEAGKEFTRFRLKQALFGGDPELLAVEEVAAMRDLREILGELAMLVASPGRAIAGCLVSPASRLAGCLKAMVDKTESEN